MKSLNSQFHTKTIIYFITCFMLLNTYTGMAAIEIEKIRKQGGELINQTTYTLEENMFYTLPANSHEIRNTGKVILGFDHYNNTYISDAKEFIVTVDVRQWSDASSSPVVVCENKPLTISYDPNNKYQDLYVFKTDDCRKIEVTVKSLSVNGKGVPNMDPFPYIFLELEIETERYYSFDASIPIVSVNYTYKEESDQLEMYWSFTNGAESYELEWMAVDNYNYNNIGELIEADPANIEFDFANNSTRITTSNNYYSIPLVFERGFLLYRVRAITVSHEYPDKYYYGLWSAPDLGFVRDFPDQFPIQVIHESKKSWSYSSSYADNGLKKEVVNYHDGTLRGRQSVSLLNTQNDAIVQENIYDYLGRPAISVLPIPVDNERLQYHENFNINEAHIPYSWKDFDEDVSCSSNTQPMSIEQSGAANYYSEKSDYDPISESYQAYLPKANGFPFAQTEYTADNTGRIKRQGNVGPNFQLSPESEQGHESQFFYGPANQFEIDRLFGTDAGYAYHYKKNMTIDANGQASVSYSDLSGNTIATALTGGKPESLEPLASLNNGEEVTITLMDFNNPANNNRIIGNTIELNYNIIAPGSGDYIINYQIGSIDFLPECSNIYCFDGIYDLEISITDQCGVEMINGGKIVTTIGNINDLNTICQGGTPVMPLINVSFPKAGEYTFTKKITLNQYALDVYTDIFMDTADSKYNDCLPYFDDMIKDAIAQIDTTICNFDCENGGCISSLGEDYIQHQSFFGENALTLEEYNNAMLDCLAACEQSTATPSNSLINTLLADVYPGGQYASYKYDSEGSIVATEFELSVLNQNNYLPGTKIGIAEHRDANWKHPIDNYLDKNNNQAYIILNKIEDGVYNPPIDSEDKIKLVELNPANGSYYSDGNGTIPAVYPQDLEQLTDFVALFEESWCYALVRYHPEYCYYQWLQGNNQTIDLYLNSDDYDALILGAETHSSASIFNLTGYSNILDLIDEDPYFNTISVPVHGDEIGQGVNQKQQMKDHLEQVGEKNGNFYNLKQMIAASTRCDVSYNENEELPDISSTCLTEIWTGLDYDLVDYEWVLYKHMYLQYKQILQQDAAHEYAVTIGNGYNGCIGIGDDGFNHADNGFSNQYNTNSWQPCYADSYNYFATKQKRFIDRDIDPRIPDYAEADPSLAEDLEALVGGTTYLTTGQCPISTHITNLLNNLASKDELTLPSVELINNRAFTPLLYSNLTDPSGPLVEYKWMTNFNIGSFYGQFKNGMSIDGEIKLEWLDLNNPECEWADITFFFNFQYSDVSASGDNLFRVSAIYTKSDGSTGQALLFGTTSFELNNCDETTFEYYEASDFALDLQSLWNKMLDEGQFLSNFVIYNEQYPALDTYTDYATHEILKQTGKSCNGISDALLWRFSNYWYLDSHVTFPTQSCDATTKIWINDIDPPTGFAYSNLLYFKDIRPLDNEINHFKVTAVTDLSGASVEYTLSGEVTNYLTNDPSNIISLPMIEENTNFLLCNEIGISVKDDLELFLNELVDKNNLTSLASNIKKDMLFSDLLESYIGISNIPDAPHWVPVEITNQFFRADISQVMPCPDHDDSVTLQTFNCSETINFSNITSFQDMTAIYDENSNGVSTYSFMVDAVMPGGEIIKLSGLSNCFPLKNCDDCYDLYLPFTKDACLADYLDLETIINSPFVEDTIFIGKQDKFCELNLGYSTDDYLFYLSQINLYLDVDLLNIDDPDMNLLFISLSDFCTNSLSYSENSATPYYSEFLDAVLTIHADFLGTPLEIGVSPYFLTLNEFNEHNYALCISCYTNYIDGLGGGATDILTIEEFTLNNMCTMIPRDDCPKPPPNIFMSPTAPFKNPCVKELIDVETAGVYGEYYALMESIREKFILDYRTQCLQVPELLTMKYSDTEYHYTLYYYDRAGNLVKTIPPEGVKPITDPSILNDIATARKLNNNTIIQPEHTLPTTYRYDSRGLLINQNTPDAGSSIFKYDILGRLRFSQNAKQFANNYFSYIRYDEHGRIIESGESNQTLNGTLLVNSILIDDILADNGYPSLGNRNITHTIYDNSSTGFIAQQNLRSRVAAITYDNVGDGLYDYATHYSYDIHGNVDVLIQENPMFAIPDDRFKRIDYEYDLVSGNVNKVSYQNQKDDASYHKYYYDADNRITEVLTSKDDVIWKRDARYIYYKHGPLARVELGDMKVQGIDYAYTINGWLKGVNSNTLLSHRDIGKDGDDQNMHKYTGRDAYGYSLNYYHNDYNQVFSSGTVDEYFLAKNSENELSPLYNGNISSISGITHQYDITGGIWKAAPTLSHYSYDQLNRIVNSNIFTNELVISSNNWFGYQNPGNEAFNTEYTYDANGNILNLHRNGKPGQEFMDDLGYKYDRVNPLDDQSDLISNKLLSVTDAVVNSGYDDDITTQNPNNYQYDLVGNLIYDRSEEIAQINWNVSNKIESIVRESHSIKKNIEFEYDGMGNRVIKKTFQYGGSLPSVDYTWYVRDAQGNIMAVYNWTNSDAPQLTELNIYGSSRLGYADVSTKSKSRSEQTDFFHITGRRKYELTNHLGNVMTVITDRHVANDPNGAVLTDHYTADFVSSQDYYPFGALMPGRNTNTGSYRFGFQGQEKDDEIKGGGNSLSFRFRIYDPRLGRFLSVDPLTASYPWYTPYQFAGNTPIYAIDIEGAEPIPFWYPQLITAYYGWKAKLKQGTSDLLQASTNTGSYNNPNVPKKVQNVLRLQQFNQGVQTTYNGLSEPGHFALDLFGSIPVVGEPIDALNGAWYAAEGNYAYASMSFASAVGVGEIFKYGKYVFKYGDNAANTFGKLGNKYADKLKNIDVAANKVRFFDQGDANKVIVIGRGQTERVEKVAGAIGAGTFDPANYPGMSVLDANKTWIKEKLEKGYSVLDIGLEPEWTAKGSYKTGDYYGAEIQEIVNYFGNKINE